MFPMAPWTIPYSLSLVPLFDRPPSPRLLISSVAFLISIPTHLHTCKEIWTKSNFLARGLKGACGLLQVGSLSPTAMHPPVSG